MSALNWIKDLKYTDEELCQLYDYWFTLPNQDFRVKNIMGYSVMDLAKKVPFRKDLIKRMEEYEERN